MSQDHLELFFSAVRASGGWNNNPTCRQFTTAYKQLLMRHNIEGGRGNCSPQDDTEILNGVKDQCEMNNSQPATDVGLREPVDRLPYRQKFLNDRNSKICHHSLKDHPKVSKIAKFRCEML